MRYLNILKRLIKLPFAIVATPVFLAVLFFSTDWEDEWSVGFSKELIRQLYW